MGDERQKREITRKSVSISRWYNDVVLKARLADYGPARGTMVIRPYGFAIWERVRRVFDELITTAGVENAYFPLFIPMSLLEREKKHVEGFAPELAVVTHGGGKKLAEPLVVRPTSETIMYEMFAKWIQSWRDLPLKLNQWANVVRWEMRTYLFLRTTEFLWQEGHTAHDSKREAVEMQEEALEWYRKIHEDYYAIPVVCGIKSEAEKFAGADTTYSVEALMPDGKALQSATSHLLGQNFAKVFGIEFQDKQGRLDYVWQTSWGLSTRSLGGLFLTHGDDEGLVLPPKVAPIKAVVIPLKAEGKLREAAEKVKNQIDRRSSVEFDGRVEIWDEVEKSLGWKLNETELLGVPVRLVLGQKELAEGKVELKFRVGEFEESGRQLELTRIGEELDGVLENYQKFLLERQRAWVKENTTVVDRWEEFVEVMADKRGYLRAFWCGNPECEAKIKEATKATTRVLPFEDQEKEGKCVFCGRESRGWWYFAQAY